MTSYRIGDEIVGKEAAHFNELLGTIYKSKERPVCLCRPGGIEMYVVHLADRFYIKRMPNTGGEHAPECGSYEPPPELSGLGEVMGSAIIESPELGTTALRLDFSLKKVPGKAAPEQGEGTGDSVRTDGNKLTLRALLHYLWDEAGFHKWSPSMQGKRNWAVIRKYLLLAAEHKNTKGTNLSEILYVPEPWSLDRSNAIEQRRMAQMSRIAQVPGQAGPRRLMLLVGDVKEIGPSRYGHKLVIKHLSNYHFMLNEDVHKRLCKRFELELSLWYAIDGAHLMAVATFGVNKAGVASIEEIGLMVTTENWIPFENLADKSLIDALTGAGRRFVKGLRYNLGGRRPLASAVITDTAVPTALYIHQAGGGDDYEESLEELIRESKMESVVWYPENGEMPALPAAAVR
jgi:hypothetical protein